MLEASGSKVALKVSASILTPFFRKYVPIFQLSRRSDIALQVQKRLKSSDVDIIGYTIVSWERFSVRVRKELAHAFNGICQSPKMFEQIFQADRVLACLKLSIFLDEVLERARTASDWKKGT